MITKMTILEPQPHFVVIQKLLTLEIGKVIYVTQVSNLPPPQKVCHHL